MANLNALNLSWCTSNATNVVGSYLGSPLPTLSGAGAGTDVTDSTSFYLLTNPVYDQGGTYPWDFATPYWYEWSSTLAFQPNYPQFTEPVPPPPPASGSIIFYDSSPSARTIYSTSGVGYSATVKDVGTGSAELSPSGYISFDYSNDFNFGSSNFKFDARVRMNTLPLDFSGPTPSIYAVYVQWQDANNYINIFISYESSSYWVNFYVMQDGADLLYHSKEWAPSPVVDQWYQLTIERVGNDWTYSIDGSQIDTVESDSSVMPNFAGIISVGGGYNSEGWDSLTIDGYLDEYSVDKGSTNVLLLHFDPPVVASGIYYVDSVSGDDSNNGTSISTPWKTIDKVNDTTFSAGDQIFFKRGSTFRGGIVPSNDGDASGYITYGAYGTGDKPKLLGSEDLAHAYLWTNPSGNIWEMSIYAGDGTEYVTNGDFDTDISGWSMYANPPAAASGWRDTSEYYASPASLRVDCSDNGSIITDLQLMCSGPFTIESGKKYKLSFYAKGTSAFQNQVVLQKNSSPYTDYSTGTIGDGITLSTDWQDYDVIFTANTSASDAMINFFSGNEFEEGGSMWIDSVSFQEVYMQNAAVDGTNLDGNRDVGNLIFNNEQSVGWKKFSEGSLSSQGDFYYDATTDTLKIYSESNPGVYYSQIEAAFFYDGVYLNKSYIIVENLDFRYFGAHCIGGGNGSHHAYIQDNNIAFVGGCLLIADLFGYFQNVRFGNGVEFWNDAHDCTVRRNTVDNVFDTAFSHQTGSGFTEAYNLYFYNNKASNCEWATEQLLGAPGGGYAHDIYYEFNTFVNMGFGKTHAQRNNFQYGAGNRASSQLDTQDNIYIRNNIYYNCRDASISFNSLSDYQKQIVSNNCYYSTAGYLSDFTGEGDHSGEKFSYTELSEHQTYTNNDDKSIVANPQFADSLYKLTSSSPCIRAGVTSSICTTDFDGNLRGRFGNPTMGAYEWTEVPLDPSGFKYQEYYLYSNKQWEMAPVGVSFYNLTSAVHQNAPIVITASGFETTSQDHPWAQTSGLGKYDKVGYGYFHLLDNGQYDPNAREFTLSPDSSGKIIFNGILTENVYIEYEGGPSGYYIMDNIDYNPIRGEAEGGFVHFSQPTNPATLFMSASQGAILADGYRGCTLTATLYDTNFDRVPDASVVFEIQNLVNNDWSELGYLTQHNGTVLSVDSSGYNVSIRETTNRRGEVSVKYTSHNEKSGIAQVKAYYLEASGIFDSARFAQYYLSAQPFMLDWSLLDTLDYLI